VKRSVVVAVLIIAVVLGGALLLYPRLFEDPATTVAVPTASRDAGPPRATAPTAAADAGVDETNGTGDGGTAASSPTRAQVVAVRGLVQTRGSDDKWRPVNQGDYLDVSESVRTGRNGEAKLAVGQGVEVRLSPRSEFSLKEIAEGVSRIRLEEGQVSASVDENGQQVLKIEAKGSDAVAEARGGTFGMVTDGLGQVAVATTTGVVKLSSKGSTVDVAAGTQSTVAKDSAPSAPVEIPKSLFLKVVGPPKQTTNSTTTTVRGTTSPGALVTVAGETTVADSKGRFRAKVRLKDGVNQLNIDVLDAQGNKKTEALPDVIVDRKAPEIDATMQWGQSPQ